MSFRICDDAMRIVIRAVWQIEEGMRQFMANDFPKVPLLVLQPEIGNAQINLAFRSLNRTLPLRGEVRMRLNNENKILCLLFCIVFGFHYFAAARRRYSRSEMLK